MVNISSFVSFNFLNIVDGASVIMMMINNGKSESKKQVNKSQCYVNSKWVENFFLKLKVEENLNKVE